MKLGEILGSKGARRVAVATICLLALVGVGLGATRLLHEEASQANALVEEGKLALAQDDRGRAVLAFERARWFAPRAESVRSALAAAAVEDPEPLPFRAFDLVTAREWSILATASGWLAGLACAVVIARRRRGLLAGLAFGASGAFVVALVGVLMSSVTSLAVVTKGDGALLLAPYAGAAAIAPLPSGATVLVGARHEGFVRVQVAGGASGWTPRESVAWVASSNG